MVGAQFRRETDHLLQGFRAEAGRGHVGELLGGETKYARPGVLHKVSAGQLRKKGCKMPFCRPRSKDMDEIDEESDCLTRIMASQRCVAVLNSWKFFFAIRLAVILTYYGLAIPIFYALEGWDAITVIYWLTVSITTVGYGDVAPETTVGRVFAIVYLLFGLTVIITVFASIWSAVLSSLDKSRNGVLDLVEDNDGHPFDQLKQPHLYNIATSLALIFVMLFLGSIIIYACGEDGISYTESLWWSFVTTTTIGYGDISTQKDATKLIVVFFILSSVFLVAVSLAKLSAVGQDMRRETNEKNLMMRLDLNMLLDMDKDGDGVCVNEYTIGMLLLMELVQPKYIVALRRQFEKHDVDKSGRLDKEDLRVIAEDLNSKRQAKFKAAAPKSGSVTPTPAPFGPLVLDS